MDNCRLKKGIACGFIFTFLGGRHRSRKDNGGGGFERNSCDLERKKMSFTTLSFTRTLRLPRCSGTSVTETETEQDC